MSSQLAVPFVRACSLVAALALAACSSDASRDALAPTAPGFSGARVASPFRGTLEAVQKSVVPLGPTTILGHSEGIGTATHLGHYTIVSDATINLETLAGTEQVTLTAANGDELFVSISAQATPNSDGVTLTVVETATITGGTGRFAGATGSYVARCQVNQATGVSTGTFEGTISIVH